MNNLLLTGGIFHPFDEAAPALASLLGEVGFTSEITEDLESGLNRLNRESFDLLTVYALRWTMQTGEKYEPYREQWALSLSESSRRAVLEFVSGGGALLALHTALICFDDWNDWSRLLGAEWIWGTSGHPPFGLVQARRGEVPHAITAGVEDFELKDEVYCHMRLETDVEPLFTAQTVGQEQPHPVLWTRDFGSGRVVVDALGHDAPALQEPTHVQLLQRSALWATHQLKEAS